MACPAEQLLHALDEDVLHELRAELLVTEVLPPRLPRRCCATVPAIGGAAAAVPPWCSPRYTSPNVQSLSASMPFAPSSNSRRKRRASALSRLEYGLHKGKFLRQGSSISISALAIFPVWFGSVPGWSHHVRKQLRLQPLRPPRPRSSEPALRVPSHTRPRFRETEIGRFPKQHSCSKLHVTDETGIRAYLPTCPQARNAVHMHACPSGQSSKSYLPMYLSPYARGASLPSENGSTCMRELGSNHMHHSMRALHHFPSTHPSCRLKLPGVAIVSMSVHDVHHEVAKFLEAVVVLR